MKLVPFETGFKTVSSFAFLFLTISVVELGREVVAVSAIPFPAMLDDPGDNSIKEDCVLVEVSVLLLLLVALDTTKRLNWFFSC